HCEAISGRCTHCLIDAHCPNGLSCANNACIGALRGAACPTGVQCDDGLICVNYGGSAICLGSCNAYAPMCPTSQICYLLKYTESRYIFNPELLGICLDPAQGAHNYRDTCTVDATGLSNCQPSLQCVPDTALTAQCRT